MGGLHCSILQPVLPTTDLKAEAKYAFTEYNRTGNTHVCGAELESHHFHVSVDGYDTVLETEILIAYDQTNTRRHLVSIPITKNMWYDEVWDAEEMDFEDGVIEVGVGEVKYDAT